MTLTPMSFFKIDGYIFQYAINPERLDQFCRKLHPEIAVQIIVTLTLRIKIKFKRQIIRFAKYKRCPFSQFKKQTSICRFSQIFLEIFKLFL